MKSRSLLLSLTGIFLVLLAATAWAQYSSNGPADPQATYPQAGDPQDAYPQAGGPPMDGPQMSGPQMPGPQDQNSPGQDPPGRVARLQYMNGQVSVQPQGTGDWVEGSANRPLTNADNVWADKDSRAELDMGTGLMRINSETSLTLTNVSNNAVQVSLHQGALNLHVRHLYNGEVWEVDTPNLAFTVKKPGDYRFDVDSNGDSTMVTVRKGEGQATGQGPTVVVHKDEQAQFSGGNSLAHQIHAAPQPDGFDEWCSVRDKRDNNSVSARYVAPGVVGSEDLDEYGTWKNYPDYGPVWSPTAVAPGWAPYSNGQWMWVSPWGWTWVDAAPWGFAPFHYGRWAYVGGGWGWIPGPYWAQPWYAPALVGWFGGPGWGFGFGFGWGWGWGWGGGPRYGWCPLGYREPFHPYYGVSRAYFRNVNLSNSRIANFNRVSNNYFSGAKGAESPSHFANASKPGGLTAASQNTLQHGLPVNGNSVHVTPNDLKGAQSLSRVNVNPTKESMLGAKASPGARPSSATFSRPTVSRMTPPAVSQRAAASQMAAAHGASTANHSMQNSSTAHSPETQSRSIPAPAGRNVPRPSQSVGSLNHGANPRPPNNASSAQSKTEPAQMAMNRNVPRPPQSSMRSYAGSSSPYFGSRSVPRPTGQVQPAPRSYSGTESRGGYSNRAYGGSYGGSYGGRGGYDGRSYGSPYGGSYGNRGSYSAPSSHSNGSSGSYHGSTGGGSHGSSGGGHSSGGGGHR
ncbi:MAG TPA: DUF6600 domain-containing protein [Terriglobales bacterium]|nr:DUF6600 domain-containing protein [Terriglobales bacterium]